MVRESRRDGTYSNYGLQSIGRATSRAKYGEKLLRLTCENPLGMEAQQITIEAQQKQIDELKVLVEQLATKK